MAALRFVAICVSLFALSFAAAAQDVVNVYSYRQPALVQPLFDAFTAKTGIAVKVLFADKGLVERLEQEGELSPADLLLTSDVGRLVDADRRGLAQAVQSQAIESSVPATLRSPDGKWFGLTLRARVVYASAARVSESAISYEELADPKWKGRVCMRAADHPYNLALISDMIGHRGLDKTRDWLLGVKANLVSRPAGDDRAQAKSVWAGECDLGLGNTYYVGLMATNEKEPEQKAWAKAIKVLLPRSNEMPTHINVSGMLMATHAPHRDAALALMEFLASPDIQKLYADKNFEYPVNESVAPSQLILDLGPLARPTSNVAEIAAHQAEAVKLVQETGINQP